MEGKNESELPERENGRKNQVKKGENSPSQPDFEELTTKLHFGQAKSRKDYCLKVSIATAEH